MQRLPDDSMTTALAQGGAENLGWGIDRHLLASVYDAINTNTKATGMWEKGKAPKFKPFPRPADKAEKKTPQTVAGLFAKMHRR
ncbi:hypothetical protein [Cellulomonas sp. SG140]|uniref:hypothetical protein n=1 Tax=Cellulomonas sp. SG140 TaxID=2976536 RepID=UPI0021E719C3|nr:hypothetical protein [Cellulomonas sp. SG140]